MESLKKEMCRLKKKKKKEMCRLIMVKIIFEKKKANMLGLLEVIDIPKKFTHRLRQLELKLLGKRS